MANPLARLSDYQHLSSGKVREIYRVDDDLLLMVASDRISAYDHILPTTIPDKGRILTAMSAFWFGLLSDLVPNHLVAIADDRIPAEVAGRAMLVRDLAMLPVECVARGYLSGSALAEYRVAGSVCGVPLPPGLEESDRLPEPIFTPATKASLGEHDENVTLAAVARIVGDERAVALRDTTLAVYRRAAAHAASRGLLLADTKLEFGLRRKGSGGDGALGDWAGGGGGVPDGRLVLADEVLTPDSSRYWPMDDYAPGGPQSSFDKQYLRDWLTSPASGWDRHSDMPPPPLPPDVVQATRERYVQAYERISGLSFADWPGDDLAR